MPDTSVPVPIVASALKLFPYNLNKKLPTGCKPLEEWKPTERRWLWVKKECMPDDLRKLLYPKENVDQESDKS